MNWPSLQSEIAYKFVNPVRCFRVNGLGTIEIFSRTLWYVQIKFSMVEKVAIVNKTCFCLKTKLNDNELDKFVEAALILIDSSISGQKNSNISEH